ncbi:hypothetical protein [Erwinia tracheiphila]|uniref:hypothetical protein n=1 Tax=Erwinia tracheiphila TaxID=65700 RepID=UPI000B2F20D9|nr:hypothetical protein [Erwinia tracheiphila]
MTGNGMAKSSVSVSRVPSWLSTPSSKPKTSAIAGGLFFVRGHNVDIDDLKSTYINNSE